MVNRDKRESEKKWKIGSRKKNLVMFDSLGSFTPTIAKELSDKYNVVIEKHFKPALAWWADTVWFEWGDHNLIEATRLIHYDQKIIVRVHGYEVYIDLMKKVNWNVVDQLIFVSDHTRDIFLERYPEAVQTGLSITVIPNGVEMSKFHFKKREHGKTFAYAGNLNSQKNPTMLIEMLRRLPSDYKLRIVGDWQELREKYHFEYKAKQMGLKRLRLGRRPDGDKSQPESYGTAFIDDSFVEGDLSTARILIENWTGDMDSWLEDKNYMISTSLSESFSYVVAEAMAKGIKPIIFDRLGVSEIWGSKFSFKTIDEAVEMILPDSEYDSKSYKKLVKERYALKYQIKAIRKILSYDKTREEPKREGSEPTNEAGKATVLTLSDEGKLKSAIIEQHI